MLKWIFSLQIHVTVLEKQILFLIPVFFFLLLLVVALSIPIRSNLYIIRYNEYICMLLMCYCYRQCFQTGTLRFESGPYFYIYIPENPNKSISEGWNWNCTICSRSPVSHNTSVYLISYKMLTHISISNHMTDLLLMRSSSWRPPVLTKWDFSGFAVI